MTTSFWATPKTFPNRGQKMQLLDLAIENFQSLTIFIESENFPQLNIW